MYKGNKVAIKANADLWRPITAGEVTKWRADLDAEAEAARAKGEDTFPIYMDSGGESRLAPRTKYRPSTSGDWTVVRARCAADRGYHRVAGCCLLRHTDGTEWFALRDHVAVLSVGTGKAKGAPKARVGTDADIEVWVGLVNTKFGGSRVIDWGRKFAKVVNGTGVYCFVDRANGDILKAASLKGPAKRARGSIYATDPLAGVGAYGTLYLK